MSLLRQGKAQSLTIYLGESDQWQGKPLYVAIIQLLRENGCAGATATRAIAGYGAGARLHEQDGWRWSSDASVVIHVIDQPERLQRLLPRLQEMLGGGLITLQEVDVLKYTHAHTHGLPTRLPVRQIMETAPVTVHYETHIGAVIDLLLAEPFRVLSVVDEQKRLKGIISTGDLINAGVLPVRRGVVRTALTLDSLTAEAVEIPLEQARRSDLTAQDVMNRQVRTVAPDRSIREAAQLMLDTKLRRLPVVGPDGVLLGMLARSDLLQVIVTSPLLGSLVSNPSRSLSHSALPAGGLQQQPIAYYMFEGVATVSEQTALAEVIDALILSPYKRVIVVDEEQRVKGIISDVDVLARVQEEIRPGFLHMLTHWARGTPGRMPSGSLHSVPGKVHSAADIMNREVMTVSENASVQETIERMMVTGHKVLPVVDMQDRLKGIVGRSDILKILIEG